MEIKTVTYTYEAKPITLNKYRTLHHRVWGPINKEWRTAFFYLAKRNLVQFTGLVDVVVRHEVKKGVLADTSAIVACYKAGQDGCKDAGVIVDDSPKYVRNVTFLRPEKSDKDALSITFVEVLKDSRFVSSSFQTIL